MAAIQQQPEKKEQLTNKTNKRVRTRVTRSYSFSSLHTSFLVVTHSLVKALFLSCATRFVLDSPSPPLFRAVRCTMIVQFQFVSQSDHIGFYIRREANKIQPTHTHTQQVYKCSRVIGHSRCSPIFTWKIKHIDWTENILIVNSWLCLRSVRAASFRRIFNFFPNCLVLTAKWDKSDKIPQIYFGFYLFFFVCFVLCFCIFELVALEQRTTTIKKNSMCSILNVNEFFSAAIVTKTTTTSTLSKVKAIANR